MKKLITTVVLTSLLSVSAYAADIVCAKAKGDAFYRPVSPLALEIAKDLNVKSCRGQKFNLVAKKLNKKIVKRAMTKAEKEAWEKSQLDSIDTSAFEGQ